jgi:hypothetical protein
VNFSRILSEFTFTTNGFDGASLIVIYSVLVLSCGNEIFAA